MGPVGLGKGMVWLHEGGCGHMMERCGHMRERCGHMRERCGHMRVCVCVCMCVCVCAGSQLVPSPYQHRCTKQGTGVNKLGPV